MPRAFLDFDCWVLASQVRAEQVHVHAAGPNAFQKLLDLLLARRVLGSSPRANESAAPGARGMHAAKQWVVSDDHSSYSLVFLNLRRPILDCSFRLLEPCFSLFLRNMCFCRASAGGQRPKLDGVWSVLDELCFWQGTRQSGAAGPMHRLVCLTALKKRLLWVCRRW